MKNIQRLLVFIGLTGFLLFLVLLYFLKPSEMHFTFPSPNTQELLVVSMEPQKNNPQDKHIHFTITDAQTQAKLSEISTNASPYMNWKVKWLSNKQIQLDSSDTGIYCWAEVEKNYWVESSCSSSIQLGDFTFDQSQFDLVGNYPEPLVTKSEGEEPCSNSETFSVGGVTEFFSTSTESKSWADFKAWNTDKLTYWKKDPSTQAFTHKLLNQVKNLDKYSNVDTLQKLTARQRGIDQSTEYSDPWKDIVLNVDPWLSLTQCSGNTIKVPIFIKKIRTAEYDTAYYVEYYGFYPDYEDIIPSSEIILNKNSSWLIISAVGNFRPSKQTSEEVLKANTSCIPKKSLYNPPDEVHFTNWPHCAEKEWQQKYRNQKEIDDWSQKVIDAVNYSPQK